jgi:transposase
MSQTVDVDRILVAALDRRGASRHHLETARPVCYRLKDFRRVATRYDKLARNYFFALCFGATVMFSV